MGVIQFKFDISAPDYPGAEVLDCTSMEGVRRYCDPASEAVLKAKIAGRYGGVHLLGSGDYHYLTKLITDSVSEPFELLLFDHHPDMQAPAFEGMLSCGGWLRDMLRDNPLLSAVKIFGINPALRGETEGWGARVQVYAEGDTILPPEPQKDSLPVYISIDKDVFCGCVARTSWDQGSMTMPQLEGILPLFTKGRRILGADICGSVSLSEGALAGDCTLNHLTDNHLIKLLNL